MLHYALWDFGHKLGARGEKNYARQTKFEERAMSLMKKLVVVYRIKDKEKQLGLGGACPSSKYVPV